MHYILGKKGLICKPGLKTEFGCKPDVFIAFQDQQMWFHTVILKCVRSYLMFYPGFFNIMDPESYFYTCFLHVSEHMCRFTA